ncbi:MAG: DUF927 domain-containing protein [Oscillospiraceae bacterium]|nr:DUF927 domain-containing protein [Oscillospiraceae bacterium]
MITKKRNKLNLIEKKGSSNQEQSNPTQKQMVNNKQVQSVPDQKQMVNSKQVQNISNQKQMVLNELPVGKSVEELLSYISVSADGTKVYHREIDHFDTIEITEDEADICKKIGIKSFYFDSCNRPHPCTVVKAHMAWAMLNPKEEDKPYSLTYLAKSFELIRKVKAADGTVYLDIRIGDDLSTKDIRFPSTVTTQKGVTKLERFNIALNPSFSETVAFALGNIAEKLPTEDASAQLGVVPDPTTGKLRFLAYGENGMFKMHTNYERHDDFIADFNDLIKKSKPLQYLLCATMSATVLTILQKDYTLHLNSYCINIVGPSSTGKTIAQRTCAAVWTNPNDDAIFSAMLSTGNAALKRLSGRYGIPTFVDESTVLGGVKASEYAYSVYEGREKRRLNSDCSEKPSGTWSTIVCMSSEEHFHDTGKNQNGGLAVRVHSMENLAWTVSKEHAEDLNEFIRRNYGIIGYKYTQLLFGETIYKSLPKRYRKAKECMEQYCDPYRNQFTDRLCQTYALTYMTGELLSGLCLEIDLKGVANIMVEHNQMVGKEQNIAQNAFRTIVSYMTRNPLKSGIRRYQDKQSSAVTKIAVEESLLREILSKNGFHDFSVAIRELDKAGFLIRQVEKGLKSKLTIDGNLCWCYQIDMGEFCSDSIATQTNPATHHDNHISKYLDDSINLEDSEEDDEEYDTLDVDEDENESSADSEDEDESYADFEDEGESFAVSEDENEPFDDFEDKKTISDDLDEPLVFNEEDEERLFYFN